jgi:hypothetical protein
MISLYSSLLELQQFLEESILAYLHCRKAYNDKLTAISKPLPLINTNMYLFKGQQLEFKDMVITLMA